MSNKRFEKELILFGKRIKALRKELDISQLDLELRTGINRAEISRIENGLNNIEFLTIVKLAAALKVELVELFTDKEEEEEE